MSLYIRDSAVDDLAKQVQKLTKAPNKTEAVRRALENELARVKESIPLAERIGKIQDAVAEQLGPNPKPFDMKAFTDDLWDT
ncbi:type II toxin-antitoxin system VapB family antitoxin [Agrobacterium tumefaciens]|uniref:type II toxin-antitoxin system VapB family antitoxin n=1 Tax=Agrobacterium tumefaciens TaxID=358 RepID=UPI001571CC6A|nr:type II toxin-antitoxin system VapB family antitoxin [Agrobacterium tumefaciens]MCZ7497253.1 type II toxin-antitoxin system VapB family antitoxin [Rhizobium rhizogenes]NTE56470.1 type II toxin-antitoxin system VapB family antitoxin [Agrobacterium tumefaciens]NTE74438.1 type II toxin-antitoxin system VapB family antitoxin [Agrobacterium tumefaciens]